MTPQKLKISILQSAVQGKIVKHSEASLAEKIMELRKKINYSKKKMEKISSLTEFPYDIPESWVWVRLGEVAEVIRGLTFSKSSKAPKDGYILVLRGGNIDSQTEKLRYDDNIYVDESIPKEEQYLVDGDCLIVASSGTKSSVGKSCYVEKIPPKTSFGGFMMVVRCGDYIEPKIISYHIKLYRQKIISDTVGYISNITNSILNNLLIPLPPIEEQRRIIARIEEVFPYIDRYAEAYEKLEQFNAQFPEDMKKSILQYAIQGKLVEQRPEEGTAEELYQQIQEEKQKLIKEGKIKKEKPLAEITEDEIPFDIPESWKWVRLKSVCRKIVDGDHNPPTGQNQPTEYLMLSATNINNDGIVDLDKVRYVTKEVFEIENQRTNVEINDVLFTIVGSMGRSCVYKGGINICFQRSVAVLTTLIYPQYLKRVLDTPFVQNFMYTYATGTAQKGFYLKQVENLVIPLPPLEEQRRIVDQIEILLLNCERLVK